jgi:hypothetical protein
VGDLIICTYNYIHDTLQDPVVPGMSWNGLSFTKVVDEAVNVALNTSWTGIWVVLVTAGHAGTAAIQIAWEDLEPSGGAACLAESWAGVASADLNAYANDHGATGAPNSGSATPTVAHSLAFCVAYRSANPAVEGTWVTGLVEGGHGHYGTHHLSTAYRILTTAAAVAAQKTGTSSGTWAAIVAFFEALPNTSDASPKVHILF